MNDQSVPASALWAGLGTIVLIWMLILVWPDGADQTSAVSDVVTSAMGFAAQQKAYLDTNGAKEGVTVTQSGLQYRPLSQSGGDVRPAYSDVVKVHYAGRLIDGKQFDSSYSRGTPAEFPLSGVIPGWTEGLQYMAVGDKYEFTIPSDLAYGERGAGPDIPPGATLVFEVELLEILN